MDTLGLHDIFSSAAKVALIEALYHHPRGLSLRELANISGVQLRSAQLAVESLHEQKIVRTRRVKNRVIISPRVELSIWTLLSAISRENESFKVRERAASYANAAPVLEFIASGQRLVSGIGRRETDG